MRPTFVLIGIILSCTVANGGLPTFCERDLTANEEVYGVFAGRYEVIGRHLDSDKIFSGHITMSIADSLLTVRREVGRNVAVGRAYLAHCLADHIPILFLEFKDHRASLDGLCRWTMELDNYPRLTCEVVKATGKTGSPGLEAYFWDHGAR
jgi:hypothetical protein